MGAKEIPKPTAAFVLSLIGGIISLIVAIIMLLIAFSWMTAYRPYYYPWQLYLLVGVWLLVAAIVVTIGSVVIYQHPEKHKNWGIIILVFSVLGGGGVLGIIGGALAITWKPTPAPTPTPVSTITRICPQCGRVLTEEVKFCPYYGKELG